MSFPRYPAYKDSGVEWLGDVPEHWEVKPAKRLIGSIEQGWSPLCENYSVDGSEGWGVLKVGCVNGGVFRPTENKLLPVELDPRPELAVLKGDLLVSRANTRELVGSAAVAIQDYPNLLLCDKLYRLKVDSKQARPQFLSYFLGSREARGKIELEASGASDSMLNISQSVILELPCPAPPACEQASIATFLDHETTKIDALIAEQQRLIALLQEKRQAVISHAVTKGLNPDVPMKDSGVEWLGEVPEHWEIIEARREIIFLTSGSRGWAEFYSETGPLFLRIGNLTRNSLDIDLSDAQRVDPPLGSEGARTEVKQGDVLFSITAYLGSVAVVPSSLEAAYVSQHVCLARLAQKRVLPKWLGYVVMSSSGKAYLEAESYGGTKVQLSLDDIKAFPVAVPPINEQQDLVTYIEEVLFRLDRLAIDSEKNIALLQERRSALISAAVTGQIDVRGLVPELAAA